MEFIIRSDEEERVEEERRPGPRIQCVRDGTHPSTTFTYRSPRADRSRKFHHLEVSYKHHPKFHQATKSVWTLHASDYSKVPLRNPLFTETSILFHIERVRAMICALLSRYDLPQWCTHRSMYSVGMCILST